MKHRVLYWVVIVALAGAAGFLYWQQRQERRQMQQQMRLLDVTLQVANERAYADAEKILRDMQQAIRFNRNQPRDLLLLNQTQALCYRADSIVRSIAASRRNIQRANVALNRGDNIPKRARDDQQAADAVTAYMGYIKQIMTTPTFPDSSFDTHYARQIEQFMQPLDGKMAELQTLLLQADEYGNKNSIQADASVSEALAMLSQREAVVRAYELLALWHQNDKIGCSRNIVFDKTGVFAAAESNTVSVGEKYKAELFLTNVLGLPVSEMTVNGKSIAVGPDKHGQVEFIVPALAGKAPGGKAYWIGTIRTVIKGRDSTFKVMVPYTVRAN